MSTKNFILSSNSVYMLLKAIFIFGVIGFFASILKGVAQPYNISQPIHFSIKDAGELVKNEKHKISISSARGKIRYSSEYTPPIKTLIVYHGSRIARGALILFILFQMREIAQQAVGGNPFTNKSSSRLLTMGWAVLGLAFLLVLEQFFTIYSFEGKLNDVLASDREQAYKSGYKTGFILGNSLARLTSSSYLYVGLFLIVLSNIFRTGTAMKEEVDLTI